MKLAIIGAGYVGLVTGACLADAGHDVRLVDRDAARIAALNAGRIPIFEPGLEALVERTAAAGRLHFATTLETSVTGADVIFIAVGTPARDSDGGADLTALNAAVDGIAPHLSDGQVVAIKSTAPAGTSDSVAQHLTALCPELSVSVVSNPEFLREGAAIADFSHPDRIVVGAEDDRGRTVMSALYETYTAAGAPLVLTGRRTAELIKYTANAFLAMKVTFINEVADYAELTGANVTDIARGIGLDSRIGTKFLNPGPGFGGSCFPKDTSALTRSAANAGAPLRLVETMLAVNGARPARMAEKVIAALGGNVRGKIIAVLGLTFKPETDDTRDSPSLGLIAALTTAGAKVVAHDPAGMENAKKALPSIGYATTPYAAAANADAIVLATEWTDYRSLDFYRLRSLMRGSIFVDLRNVHRGAPLRAAGFRYHSIGRPAEDG